MSSARELLDRFGLRPKHSFGQNFLTDRSILERIHGAIVGDAPRGALTIVEIGAGLGALTGPLLASGHRVIAIERDRELLPVLREEFAEFLASGKLKLLEADAKAVDWAAEFEGAERPVLAGNLPYQITGPLLEKTCLLEAPIERAVFLVQKEVGDRLAAAAGSDDYGALSVFVQARFRVTRALVVGGGAFYPPPRVASAVVVFVPHPVPISAETPMFRKLVHGAFHARRKTLRNAWKGIADADVLEASAREAGISLDARGETLSVERFAAMARNLESGELP